MAEPTDKGWLNSIEKDRGDYQVEVVQDIQEARMESSLLKLSGHVRTSQERIRMNLLCTKQWTYKDETSCSEKIGSWDVHMY